MRRARIALFLVALTSSACLSGVAVASYCKNTSTGRVPLTDLGAGLYLGQFEGGLYPNGSNTLPDAQMQAGLAAASAIVPRDVSGNPDPQGGKVILLSIGMSNTSDEWCQGIGVPNCTAETFGDQAWADIHVNHATLDIVNGAQGGAPADQWESPTDTTYNIVRDQRLAPRGETEAQVQVIWLKQADAGPTSSLPSSQADAYTLESRLGNILRAIKVRYPNIGQVFLSSRIYAGYASTTLNPEPYAYESGFSVKWLVQAQITQMATQGTPPDHVAGDLNYTTVAPWIAWAAYLWADGTIPRSDGLTWVCSDFQTDGTHPSTSGDHKVGAMLLAFFLHSPLTESWFVAVGGTTTSTTTSSTTTTRPRGCG